MLQRVLVISGVAAVVAIVALTVVVLDKPPGAADHGTTTAIDPIRPDGNELPDPGARGVVILGIEGQLYSYTPDGEASGGPFAAPFFDGNSPDGAWQALQFCPEAPACKLVIVPTNSTLTGDITQTHAVELDGSFVSGEWSRSGASFAALDDTGSLYTVEPFTREANVVQACCVTAYTWTAHEELLIAGQGKWSTYWLARAGVSGPATKIDAALTSAITRFYEAPDATQFAFAQNEADGLALTTLDMPEGRVTRYGALHQSHEAEGATPFAIAWSHDQRYIAVGPVQTPYELFVLDTETAVLTAAHTFEEGYAGELVWSPTENRLAISTYSPDRARHEVYVVDATAGAKPRHLLGGCRIVWSPDGQFLAVKAEPHTFGAAAVNVETGHLWQLTTVPGMTPVAWGEDESSARQLIATPGRSAAVLGK